MSVERHVESSVAQLSALRGDEQALPRSCVSGNDASLPASSGCPVSRTPAVFLEAARRLQVAPNRAVVVEYALAGVAAGRRGRFGLVIGVDRTGASRRAAGRWRRLGGERPRRVKLRVQSASRCPVPRNWPHC